MGEEAGRVAVAAEARRVDWEGCLNARDLGGLPLRTGGFTTCGVVVRSDDLARLTTRGAEQFAAADVTAMLDLRFGVEVERWPSPQKNRPGYRNVPLWNDDVTDAVVGGSLADVYRALTVRARAELKAIFTALAEGVGRGTVVVHCFSGKDRTGLACGLLLDLCNVEREAIGEDFAASEANLRPMFDEWLAAEADLDARAVLAQELTSCPVDLIAALEYVDHTWGGVKPFLLGCGVNASHVDGLRGRLTAGG
jgi:protein-tyrosine phosphatase